MQQRVAEAVPRTPAEAAPYTFVRSPNLRSELITKHDMINLMAHSKDQHEGGAEQAAVNIHRAMLSAIHSMHAPTGMEMQETGRWRTCGHALQNCLWERGKHACKAWRP